MPSKLVPNIENPIFAIKTSKLSTAQYYAILFSLFWYLVVLQKASCCLHSSSRSLSLLHPQESFRSPTGLCEKCPWCFESLDSACWAQRVPKALVSLEATLGCSYTGASCTGNPKHKLGMVPACMSSVSWVNMEKVVFSKCSLTALCLDLLPMSKCI